MNSEYKALVEKVDTFTQRAFSPADMSCARGCHGCCHVWLTVNQVEAAELRLALSQLPPTARARAVERGQRELAREQTAAEPPRCALLEDTGECAVYAHRPLVCRTQGYGLRYPSGFIPQAAVRARSSRGELTYCPLNFSERAPDPASVLDAERVDQILAVVNQRFCREIDPNVRHAIHGLAAQALQGPSAR